MTEPLPPAEPLEQLRDVMLAELERLLGPLLDWLSAWLGDRAGGLNESIEEDQG